MEDTDKIIESECDNKDKLYNLFSYLTKGILRYPNLIRAHLNAPLMHGNPDSSITSILETWMNLISSSMEGDLTSEQRYRLQLFIFSGLASVIFAGLFPDTEAIINRINLHDENKRRAFINLIVDNILAQAASK